MNRREFLYTSAAGLGLAAAGGYAAGFADRKTPRAALIGCGWYGKCDLFRLIQVAPVEVVSLCDPDKRMLAEAADLVASRQTSKKKPRTYGDYRELLKEKDLDIVIIGTPDHWHKQATLDAMKAGKDVYCEKPMIHLYEDGPAMIDCAKSTGRILQIGSQRVSSLIYIKAKEILASGAIGRLNMVTAHWDRNSAMGAWDHGSRSRSASRRKDAQTDRPPPLTRRPSICAIGRSVRC